MPWRMCWPRCFINSRRTLLNAWKHEEHLNPMKRACRHFSSGMIDIRLEKCVFTVRWRLMLSWDFFPLDLHKLLDRWTPIFITLLAFKAVEPHPRLARTPHRSPPDSWTTFPFWSRRLSPILSSFPGTIPSPSETAALHSIPRQSYEFPNVEIVMTSLLVLIAGAVRAATLKLLYPSDGFNL